MDITLSSKRRNKILESIVYLYIHSAKPISSQLIKQRYNLSISSATIRNVMAELENLDYIKHPHTSSGRIPTDKGYRFYIDSLMKEQVLTLEQKQRIKRDYKTFSGQVKDIINKTSEILSDMSYEAGVNLFFNFKESLLKCIDLISIGKNRILLIIVTDSGIIRNYIVKLDKPIDKKELREISNFLNVNLQNIALAKIKSELRSYFEKEDSSFFNLIQDAYYIFDTLEIDTIFENEYEIYQDGISYILKKPEFKDINKLRSILDVLENKEIMAEILKTHFITSSKDVKISIGKENRFKNIQECSLVTSNYRIGDRTVGILGLLGPTRMTYSKLVPLIDYMSNLLSEVLTESALDYDEEEYHD